MAFEIKRAEVILPAQHEWAIIKDIASMLVKTGFLPFSIKTPEQAMAIILKGREIGVPPMQAFAQISVINGKPALGAELMLGMIYRNYPKAPIEIIQNDDKVAAIKAGRPGGKLTQFSFTIDDAKRAGLLSKDSWVKYPQNMLYWRCVANMARALYPECLGGMSHSPEELGAEVDEEGNVVSEPKVMLVEQRETVGKAMGTDQQNIVEGMPVKKVFTGTKQQLEILHKALEDDKVDTFLWPEIEQALMGKTRAHLPGIIDALKKAYAEATFETDSNHSGGK